VTRAVARVVASCLLSAGLASCGPARTAPPVSPAPPPDPVGELRRELAALADQPGHLRGTWGVLVESMAGGERLFERNPGTLLIPASAMKLVSLAAAADAVGWDYTFRTRMLATGPVADGVLHGDLVFAGSGDPSSAGRPGHEPFAPWIEALRSRGITRVAGRVVADDDALDEPRPGFAWSWEDLGYSYGAIPGALNAGENTVPVLVAPAHLEGLPAVVELPADARDLPVANRVRTAAAGAPTELWPEFRAGEAAVSVNGTIAVGAVPATVAVAAGNPTEWFARSARNRLLAAGIDVAGPAVDVDDLPVKPSATAATTLLEIESATLAELAKPLLKDSINLYAEAVLRLATGRDGGRSTGQALDALRARLHSWGIPRESIQVVDGSGLSRRNAVAPEALVAILRRFYDGAGTAPFMQALAVAGRDGTLANRMRGTPAEANAIGKTGSMSSVRTLAGYVRSADGEPLVFAIMANNFEGPAAAVTATIDRMVARLAAFTRRPR
jgi:D-alanyl-D-alanine carboxypeptidase/D-alanyl-D-alanine-endopeptidase (penicillin-binding protein 4)